MALLTIPPSRAEDIERAKDFLFEVYGEGQWTEENYLELSDRVNRLIELSEGRLIVLPMPTPDHQDVIWNIAEVFKTWARRRGGRAFVAALPARLWTGKFREPDVMLYSPEHIDRVGKQYGGPPDIAVEVFSPSTERTDLDEKMSEYAQAGIVEYWVVSVDTPQVEQYMLENGRYRLHAQLGAGEILRSTTFTDLEIAIDAIYAG
jgi:Uma2 family endonuclease